MTEFEKFTLKRIQTPNKTIVTITKGKQFSFNKRTMSDYVKDYDYAILYYDRKNQKIGIQLTNVDTAEAYKIRKSRNNTIGNITGIAFLKHYNIPHKKTKGYSVNWDDKEKMLIVDLNE